MKVARLGLSLLVTLAFSTTFLGQEIHTDYDHKVDFSQYHTYSWMKVKADDDLWAGRIQEAVDAALQKLHDFFARRHAELVANFVGRGRAGGIRERQPDRLVETGGRRTPGASQLFSVSEPPSAMTCGSWLAGRTRKKPPRPSPRS